MTATPAGGSVQLSRLPSQTSQSSTSSNGSGVGRAEGGGSGSRSQRKMTAPPPNVPRRTVSRLSSSEGGLSPQTSRDGSGTASHNIQTTTCFLATSASSSPSNSTSKKSPSPGYLVSDVVDCRVPQATGHTVSSQVCSLSRILVSSLLCVQKCSFCLYQVMKNSLIWVSTEHTCGFVGKTFSSAGTFSSCCLQPSPT